MNLNQKRKINNNAEDGSVPTKKHRDESKKGGQQKADWKSKSPKSQQDAKKAGGRDKKTTGSNNQRSNKQKQQLTSIVTEAKANYQLYTDKKVDKDEKQLLLKSTYELVKDQIPELSRMKGMGKVIASLLDRKDKKRLMHVLSGFDNKDSKLLLVKGNGYRLAAKLIQTGNAQTLYQFVEACMSNGKGLRPLMQNFKSAAVLNSAYVHGNAAVKRSILSKLMLGNMPFSTDDDLPLTEVFAKSKKDVVEECKTFLQSILNAKTIKYEIIQDILVFCIETRASTGMEVDEFIKLTADNIIPLCRRITNCNLALWTIWLASAQMRKHIMKNIKAKLVSLLQTNNGRMFMMALIESTDDTKTLNKIVLKEFMQPLDDLVKNADARKLLEFLLAPRSTKFMHPKDVDILKQGDSVRTSKKSEAARFDEIRDYMQEPILTAFESNCEQWLQDNKLCLFIIAVVERYGCAFEADLLQKLATTMSATDFSKRIIEKAVRMVLESLINSDVSRFEANAEAPLFLNAFIPALEKKQITVLVKNCPRFLSNVLEAAPKLKKGLTFKVKKSWLNDKNVQEAVNEYKNRSNTVNK
ncbi:hypothetical protein Ocin01_08098 [Orchesella cincta]|uniref:CPL domain-containing protein n=1 Tax=Orchesella cincta TaxID=48709 RepID=A0A1D2N019_ORCCI|nr:hypothetical protein Ocin01_08098 [Orchesella cincta]